MAQSTKREPVTNTATDTATALATSTAATAAAVANTAAAAAIAMERRFGTIEAQLTTMAEVAQARSVSSAELATLRHDAILGQISGLNEKVAIQNGRVATNTIALTALQTWKSQATAVFLAFNGLALMAGPFVFWGLNHWAK